MMDTLAIVLGAALITIGLIGLIDRIVGFLRARGKSPGKADTDSKGQ